MNNSVGDKLKDSRERNSVSLSELAQDLKISETFLAALEANKFEQLPGETYAIGFIRSYANRFGLDADSLIRGYKSTHQVTVKSEQEFFDLEHPRAASKLIPVLSGIAISLLIIIIWAVQAPPDTQPAMGDISEPVPDMALSGSTDISTNKTDISTNKETINSLSMDQSGEIQNSESQANEVIPQVDGATQTDLDIKPEGLEPDSTAGGAEPLASLSEPATGLSEPAVNLSDPAPRVSEPRASAQEAFVDAIDPTSPVPAAEPAPPTASSDEAEPSQSEIQAALPVTIRAKRRTWMRIESGAGRILYSSILDEGAEFALEQDQVFSVSTRDAGAIEFFIGSEMIGRLGRDGEILANRSVNPSQLASQR